MKKVTSLICLVFVAIMVLSLPVGAATPYYTYTYSISGTDLRSKSQELRALRYGLYMSIPL